MVLDYWRQWWLQGLGLAPGPGQQPLLEQVIEQQQLPQVQVQGQDPQQAMSQGQEQDRGQVLVL